MDLIRDSFKFINYYYLPGFLSLKEIDFLLYIIVIIIIKQAKTAIITTRVIFTKLKFT